MKWPFLFVCVCVCEIQLVSAISFKRRGEKNGFSAAKLTLDFTWEM